MIELFIEEDEYRRIAIKDNGVLSECYFEDKNDAVKSGDLILGIIKKKVKALNSVFIDIGLKKNAFLYVQDKTIFSDYKEGQSLLVEVIKEEEGSKGTKVTDKISLGGKYVVIFPGKGISFSKKLDREAFLEKQGSVFAIKGYKVLYREAAMEGPNEEVSREVLKLTAEFDEILKKAETGKGPRRLYGEFSILDRIVRDRFNELDMVYSESLETMNYLKEEYNLPSMLHRGERSLFDFYGIEEELLKLRREKVNLKEGGNLVIEETEAMIVIDINSAKFSGKESKEETALAMNLSAVPEIGRQLRLRNLSGIIMIDFIDMKNLAYRETVMKRMEEELAKDSLFSKCYPLTELNLMQITRKNKGYPLRHYIEEECGFCHGRGQTLRYEYLLKLIRNEFGRKIDNVEILDYYLELNTIYEERIMKDVGRFYVEAGATGKRLYLEFTGTSDPFKLEPLVFKNQIQEKEKFLLLP